MQDSGASTPQRDGVGFVLVVALFVLTPPLVGWWASPGAPWHLPYLIWASILGASVVFRRIGRHDL
jgi:hypothetical protein